MATGKVEHIDKRPTYWTLASGAITSTATQQLVDPTKSISDFDLLLFVVKRGNYIKISQVVPRPIFEANVLDFSEVDTAGTQRWYDFTYVSSSKLIAQCRDNVSDGSFWVYGIGADDTY